MQSKDHEKGRSPDYLGHAVIKSQKDISSGSNLHLKTENDHRDD